MLKLTERLEMLANEVKKGESMADIGTDHGFLPVSLWERGISPKVIMADVSSGSLNKARENCEMLYPGETFDLRLGDGLKILQKGEVDDVVIAGMGGLLMIRIFEEDMDKTRSFRKFILQPRISAGKLRYWLLHHDFSIVTDTLVREGRFICNVITAETRAGRNMEYIQNHLDEILTYGEEDIRLDVPVWLTGHPLFEEHVNRRLEQAEDIFLQMKNSASRWDDKKRQIQNDMEYLRGLFNENI